MVHRPGFEEVVAAAADAAGTRDATPSRFVAAIEVAVDELAPARYQPRRHFADDSLIELADSIRAQGLLQPLIVRPIVLAGADATPKRYEIVAGERRWRAAKLAGLLRVPVQIRDLDDQSALAVALIENVQREDLNPIDQAESLARLAAEYELTHEQVGRALGRSRAWVSNLLRLLELGDEVKERLAQGKIDMGHARALLPLDGERQRALARKAETLGWSVRQVEKAVRGVLAAPAEDAGPKAAVDLQTRWLQRQIAAELGQRVVIRTDQDGDYTLRVGFGNLAELQDALQRLQEIVGRIRATAGPRARDSQSA